MDVVGPIEAQVANELVKLLVGGLGAAAKKVSALWRRAGESKQQVMAEELERSAEELSQAQEPEGVRTRQEALWEAHLRVLLAEYPEAETDLHALLTELRSAGSGAGTSSVHIGGDVHAEGGGVAIGGVTGGRVSLGGERQDPPRPGRAQG